tara:strand:+ start:156 stop:509 length:354 start_codon:yes stop_codon:yes gene_type:complete
MEEKDFIKKNTYPGGNKALNDFIAQNLTYPKEAIEKKIEGIVIVKFKVNSNGKVFNPKITKGIGYGCNEEAIRIVNKLKYAQAINRKIRITTSKTIKIKFKLPKRMNSIIINYEIVK